MPRPVVKTIVVCLIAVVCSSQAMAAEHQTLEQALTEAYENNPSLEAARAKLRATDEDVSQALAHWRPNLEATASAGKTYQYLPAASLTGQANYASDTHTYGVQITQPLFRGFKTLSEAEAAKKEVMAGRAQLAAAEQKMLLDAATAYLDVVRDEAVLVLDRQAEQVLHGKIGETSERARLGDLSRTDIDQADSRLARAEAATADAENTLATDRQAFLHQIGMEAATLDPPDLKLDQPKTLPEALHIADTQNPDVLAAEYGVEQAKAQVHDNEGSLLPELDLVGNSSRAYGQNVYTPGRFDNSSVLAQLTIPLYKTGADYSKVRQATQVATQKRMELEDARRHAHELAANGWQAIISKARSEAADEREVTASGRAFTGIKRQANVGSRTALDTLNAEQELLDAQADLAKSRHDRNLAILQVKAAMGQLTAEALQLPLTPYDPTKHYEDVKGKWIGLGDADADVYQKPLPEAPPDAPLEAVSTSDTQN